MIALSATGRRLRTLASRRPLAGLALLGVLLVCAWLGGVGHTVRGWLWPPMTELEARLFLMDEFRPAVGCGPLGLEGYSAREWSRLHGSSRDAEMVAIRDRLGLQARPATWTADQAWRALELWLQLHSIQLDGAQGRYDFELWENPTQPILSQQISLLLRRYMDPIVPGSSSMITVHARPPVRIEGRLDYGRVTLLKREPGRRLCPS